MSHTDRRTAPPRPLAPPARPELHGHGLRLGRWDPDSAAHADTWLRGTTDPDFLRWNTRLEPATDRAAARAALRGRARRDADGSTASFRVMDAADGTTLGHIGLNEIHPVLGHARVGYWILPEARGRGVATRALLLTARWALTELGLHRLELGHVVGHEASCRIAERCGFPLEGTLRGALFESGRRDAFRDAHLHARLATDPEPPYPAPARHGGPGRNPEAPGRGRSAS
ncbi:GNAT family protein [Streptomyces sp. NPDC012461]|uniref:GNAT family N-acetyltransferase n=1 Tax=Streptomyces sp. NPDC012461 TaxID=3155117 RepID=UPI0033D3101E